MKIYTIHSEKSFAISESSIKDIPYNTKTINQGLQYPAHFCYRYPNYAHKS